MLHHDGMNLIFQSYIGSCLIDNATPFLVVHKNLKHDAIIPLCIPSESACSNFKELRVRYDSGSLQLFG